MKKRGGHHARGPVIAIDGPSGVGKSTVSRLVAKKLGFTYIDTGAMYRAFAVAANEAGISFQDEKAIKEFSEKITISFANGGERICLNGKDVTEKIRTPHAGEIASIASSKKAVRDFLSGMQKKLAEEGSVVMEGRDISTVVAPEAEVKIFLDASTGVRARRRHKEFSGANNGAVTLEDVESAIEERDMRDTTREHSPLKKAPDAVSISTDGLSIEDVVNKILSVVTERVKVGDIDS